MAKVFWDYAGLQILVVYYELISELKKYSLKSNCLNYYKNSKL